MTARRRIAVALIRGARILGGEPTRELVDAMRAEAGYVPEREVVGWAAGSLRLAWARGSARSTIGFAVAVAGAAACFIAADAELTEPQWAMLVLLSTSFALGAARPRFAVAAGLVVGSSLAAWHVALVLAGIRLRYPMEPPGLFGALTLLVLVVPALAAALTGGWLRGIAAGDGGASGR